MSAGRQRPAVVASQVQMTYIDTHLVGKAAQKVAGNAAQTKKTDDVEAN